MKKIITILLSCIYLPLLSFSQISLKGEIQSTNNEKLNSITITLTNSNIRLRTRSNENGFFVFENVKPGKYQLILTASNFNRHQLTLPKLSSDTTIQIQMEEKTDELEGVDVLGKQSGNSKNVSPSLRLNTPILQLPQNINVINNSVFGNQSITSINDGLIRNISGAQRLEHWGDLYTRVNMRGGRAAAFLNGVNVTSNWGPLSEDMSYVERIEVVKGPAGFLMSNGEPTGIYNVVTKKPSATQAFQGAVRFTTGSFGMYRGEGDIDGKLNENIAFRLNAMAQNKGSFRANEFNDRYIVNPSLLFKIGEKTLLSTEYIFQKAKMTQVGSAYVFTFDGYGTKPRSYTINDKNILPTNVEDHTINLNLQHHINDNWLVTAQGTYINDYMLGSDIWPSLYDKNSQKMIRGLSFWESSNVMKFAQLFVNGKVQTGDVNHNILTGFDYGNKTYLADWNQGGKIDLFNASGNQNNDNTVPDLNYWYNLETNNYDINGDNPYTTANNGYPTFDKTSRTLKQRAAPGGTILQKYAGFYAQDELGFFENKLRLTLAARFTYVTQSAYGGAEEKANRITPRLGLSYSIDENTSVYSLFDQSFIPQTGIFRSGETAQPITGNSFEIGLKKDWFDGKWNTVFSAYNVLKNNAITGDPTNTASEQFSIVLGKIRARGLEFEAKGEITKGLDVTLNYALTENVVIESNTPLYNIGDRQPGYAKHAANGWLMYTLQSGLLKGAGLSFGGTYLGNRSTWAWNNDPNTLKLNDYLKFDAGLYWSNSKINTTLNIFNVFDKYLYSGSGYNFIQANGSSLSGYYYQAEAPRNFRLSIGYKF